jgi:hypothetical protein
MIPAHIRDAIVRALAQALAERWQRDHRHSDRQCVQKETEGKRVEAA